MAFTITEWPDFILLADDGAIGWTGETLPGGFTDRLNSIWLIEPGLAFAVGDNGKILKLSAGTWAADTSPFGSTEIEGVWAFNNLNAWACARQGKIAFWNGTTWAIQTTPTNTRMNAIQGADDQEVWAVGNGGTIWHTSNGGSSWAAQTSGHSNTLNTVFVVNDQEIWAAGANGEVSRTLNGGTTWSAVAGAPAQTIRAMWATTRRDSNGQANQIFFALDTGAIVLYDGATYSTEFTASDPLWGVWGTNLNRIFFVGGAQATNELIVHFDGMNYTEIRDTGADRLTAIHTIPGWRAFTCGRNPVILQNDKVYDLVGAFKLDMQFPQQPEQDGNYLLVQAEPAGTTAIAELFASETGLFEGEEIGVDITAIPVGTIPIKAVFYEARFAYAPNVARDFSPVLDRIRLQFPY